MGSSTAPGARPLSPDAPAASLALRDERLGPRRARRMVEETLRGAGLGDLVDDAASVATELVTNALLHGTTPAHLTLRVVPGTEVRIEVADASTDVPVRARPGRTAMTGRGLAVVEALSARWGVERQPGGKVVWAEVGLTAAPAKDVDADELLSRWSDLESLAESLPEPPAREEPRYLVHLGHVPTDLLLAAKAHVDNLVREFSLAAAGARLGTTASVPTHLAELIDAVVHRFAAPREAIKRQALAAANAGEDHVRLELALPLDAADAGRDYLRALDEADAYCRAARLLTLESPPQHRVFRRWYVEELIGQLGRAAQGLPPLPPQTFEQRLLQEIDALATAERAADRNARLHSLSSALASAVTPEAVTQAVLRGGVDTLRASGGAILLASETSTLVLPGALGYEEGVVEHLRVEPADAELPAALALRTGESVWLESREERNQRFPALAGLEPGTISMCAVPLVARGRRIGALRFSFSEARLFDQQERAFVHTMAALTAQALDRAQLYDQRVDVSERLQRSLLPPRLPDVPGMRVDAAYQPIGDGVDVGGDFYDVWACGPERWAFTIGDASGTGPEAAAVSALVRHTLRALTLTEMSIETVLHQLNRALLDVRADEFDDRFCTVLLGLVRLERDHCVLELGSGGHNGPLLATADGRIEEIELRGSLLGLITPAELDRRTVRLRPGDELVLYTDGVTDTRSDQTYFGLDGLVDAVRAARAGGGGTSAAVVEAVRRHGDGIMGDDVAVMSLRFDG